MSRHTVMGQLLFFPQFRCRTVAQHPSNVPKPPGTNVGLLFGHILDIHDGHLPLQ